MSAYIASIDLKSISAIPDFFDTGKEDRLDGLSRINLFVGQNNSGKSRFLRALATVKGLRYTTSEYLSQKLQDIRRRAASGIAVKIPMDIAAIGGIPVDMFNLDRDFDWLADGDSSDGYKELLKDLEFCKASHKSNALTKDGVQASGKDALLHRLHEVADEAIESLSKHGDPHIGLNNRFYIPVMRGFRTLEGPGDLFLKRTIKDYKEFGPLESSAKIFTGQDFFAKWTSLLLGDSGQRKIAENYERFLSEECFSGKKVEIIPREGDTVIHVNIEGAGERPIYELGDGHQALIALTFLPFTSQSGSLFFVEEPELFLHPGLQRRIVELYLRHETLSKHQYFLATHSNHLLDLTYEYESISTYVFRRHEAQNATEIISTRFGDKNVLTEIGARSSSVFLTNSMIWVEGITDRLYLHTLLRAVQTRGTGLEKFRLDTHYSIGELGGSNLVHWKFGDLDQSIRHKIQVARVCANSFVVIDGDNIRKANRVKELEDALSSNFYMTKGKEIENALAPGAVRFAAEALLRKAKLFREQLEEKLASITEADYCASETGLGAYLDNLLSVNIFSASTTSGALKDKLEFCRQVIEFHETNPGEKFGSEMEALAIKLLDYIEEGN